MNDNSQPAFPYTNCEDHGLNGSPGMTLRQWYAGMAMQGLLALPNGSGDALNNLVKAAFTIADTMLAQDKASE